MTTAGSIGLFVLGAILAFGVNVQIAGINIDIIGLILMGAGVVGLGIAVYHNRARSRTTVVERHHEPGVDQEIREERTN